MNKYYVISLGLHGVLLIGLINISNSSHQPLRATTKREPWIEWREDAQVKTSTQKRKSVAQRSRERGDKSKNYGRLSQLLHQPLSDTVAFDGSCSQNQICAEEQSDYISDGSAEFFQRAMEIPRFSDKVWRKIRSEVHYKRDWIRKGIEGFVKSRILVSPKGKLLTHFIDELSGPPELQAHIIGALRRALENDFLSPALPRPTLFHLYFEFRIGQEIPDSRHTLNSLVFSIVSPPPGDELQMVFINPFSALDNSLANSMNPLRRDQGHTLNAGIHLPFNFELTKNAEPEDFYETVGRYEDACLHHKNRYGCYRANQEYDKAGLLSDATRIFTQACARGLKEFCRKF